MPEQWTGVAYIAISDEDGNEYQFGALTDTIEISWGSKDIEATATVSGGRVVTYSPEEVTEISMDIFPVGISSDGSVPNGIQGWFMGLDPTASSGINQLKRKKFRVAALWTDTSPSDAAGDISSGNSLRFSFWRAYLTSAEPDYSDDILKTSVTFKVPPYDKAGNGCIKSEEAEGTSLTALGAFDGTAPS